MNELHRGWLILKRRRVPVIGVFGSVLALTTLMTFAKQPIYEAKGTLLLKRTSTASSLTELSGKVNQLDGIGGSPVTTQIEIIRSTPIIQETIAALKLHDPNPNSLLGSLRVTNIPGTDILEVAYRSTDANHAAEVVNTLMRVYKQQDIETNRAEARSARAFIEQQLPKVENTVRQAELALRRFKEKNEVVDLSAEAQTTVGTIGDAERQLTTTQAELAKVSAKTNAYRNLIGNTPRNAFVLNSPTVQQVLADLQQTEQKLALERTRFQEDAPAILDIKDRQTALQNLLKQRVSQSIIQQPEIASQLQTGAVQQSTVEAYVQAEVERFGLLNQAKVLSQLQSGNKQRASTLPRLEQQQRELERRLRAAESTYDVLSKKLYEIRVTENQNVGNVQLAAPALLPEKPVAPKRSMDLLKGGILATLLAAVIAILMEAIDRSIKTADEAKDLAGYPVLGVIPHFQQIAKLYALNGNGQPPITPNVVVKNLPESPISEAFRMLQTNLKFLNSDKAVKLIVVTSSVPKEGKSTVAANLAAATAQMGCRVLLIDADMRQPTQHQIWQVPNAVGLSNVITRQNKFQPSLHAVMPNLYLLTAGISPPNPVALLSSQRMSALLEFCAQAYDCVVIDSPPISVAADASILGKMTDGVALLVRPGVSDSTRFATSKQLLDQSGQNVLGLVVNGAMSDTHPYLYYSYYHRNGHEKNGHHRNGHGNNGHRNGAKVPR
jgi:capsular exopolysaccharide synthesis family protein